MKILDHNFNIALEYLKNKGVTAYELHKFSGQSEAGLRKLINGQIDKPRRKTKEIVIEYYEVLTEQSKIVSNVNKEYTKGLSDYTPHQISTYISENTDLFNIEELMKIIFDKSVLEEANSLLERKIKEIKG